MLKNIDPMLEMNRNSMVTIVKKLDVHAALIQRRASLGVVALVLMVAQPLLAATVIFDSNASFDTNFYKPSGTAGATKLTQAGNSLHFAPVTGQTNATAIYNTSATGGSGGNGGTALGSTLDLFTLSMNSLIVEADFKASSFDTSNGVGFYFGLNDSASSGALAIFRTSATTGSGNADVRFYTGANPTASNNVGTLSATNSFGTILTDSSKYYTFRLTLTLDGSDIVMLAQLFDGSSQLGSDVQKNILASSVNLNGQVGLRLGGGNGTTEDISRFSVYSVPEPGVPVLLGLALGTWIIFKGRTRRA